MCNSSRLFFFLFHSPFFSREIGTWASVDYSPGQRLHVQGKGAGEERATLMARPVPGEAWHTDVTGCMYTGVVLDDLVLWLYSILSHVVPAVSDWKIICQLFVLSGISSGISRFTLPNFNFRRIHWRVWQEGWIFLATNDSILASFFLPTRRWKLCANFRTWQRTGQAKWLARHNFDVRKVHFFRQWLRIS